MVENILLHTSNGKQSVKGESLISDINKLCDEELFGPGDGSAEKTSKSSSKKDGKLTKEEHKATGNVRKYSIDYFIVFMFPLKESFKIFLIKDIIALY